MTATVHRAGGTRYVAYGAAAMLVVMTVVIGVALPEDIRSQFTVAEGITLGGTLLAMLAVLHGMGRSRVRADDDGIEVVNGYRRHHFRWDEVRGFSFKDGAPWPTLVTRDDERVMMFAIQGSSGRGAARAAIEDLVRRVR